MCPQSRPAAFAAASAPRKARESKSATGRFAPYGDVWNPLEGQAVTNVLRRGGGGRWKPMGSVDPRRDPLVHVSTSRQAPPGSQLTQIGWNAVSSSTFNWSASTLTYAYSPTQNNGQITQVTDSISGETISYQYDSLKRLTIASSTVSANSQSFQYDGFANLISKTLGTTTTSIGVTAATNQLSSASYDSNGNMTSGSGATLTYDVSNRVASSQTTAGGSLKEYYGYAPDNKRMWRVKTDGTEEWTFYGAHGEKIGVYQAVLTEHFDDSDPPEYTFDSLAFTTLRESVWFDGRLLSEGGNPVLSDRLGTNRAGSAKFTAYGEEMGTSTSNDRTKFGTYNRDSFTGLDYADQRFYASTYGNFTTPDPSMENVDYTNPGSWNAYAYTNGDPINGNDPTGLQTCGQIPITSGAFAGQTLSQVFTGTNGNDLLAQIIWHEAGTLYSSDLTNSATVGLYETDLAAVGSAVLNQWDVDNGLLKVYQNGRQVCPLGQCLDRSLQQIIIAISTYKDSSGNLVGTFNSSGQMQGAAATTLSNILGTNTLTGPLVSDNGNLINQGCEGVVASLVNASNLLGGAPRVSPNGSTLLFWNQLSPDSTQFYSGYTGWRDGRPKGETFWGLPSTAPPPVRRPRPPGRGPRPL